MGMLYEYPDPYEKQMINQVPDNDDFLGDEDDIDWDEIHDYVEEDDE